VNAPHTRIIPDPKTIPQTPLFPGGDEQWIEKSVSGPPSVLHYEHHVPYERDIRQGIARQHNNMMPGSGYPRRDT
jgi:hypothetical protein